MRSDLAMIYVGCGRKAAMGRIVLIPGRRRSGKNPISKTLEWALIRCVSWGCHWVLDESGWKSHLKFLFDAKVIRDKGIVLWQGVRNIWFWIRVVAQLYWVSSGIWSSRYGDYSDSLQEYTEQLREVILMYTSLWWVFKEDNAKTEQHR